jgi:hypothetical protein
MSRCSICNTNSLENPERNFTFNSDNVEWLCDECLESINGCLSEFPKTEGDLDGPGVLEEPGMGEFENLPSGYDLSTGKEECVPSILSDTVMED